jgi:hypothetical protein
MPPYSLTKKRETPSKMTLLDVTSFIKDLSYADFYPRPSKSL